MQQEALIFLVVKKFNFIFEIKYRKIQVAFFKISKVNNMPSELRPLMNDGYGGFEFDFILKSKINKTKLNEKFSKCNRKH